MEKNNDTSLDSQNDTTASEEQTAIDEETNEDQKASAPASNKIMTPEEIANLIAAQTIEETSAIDEEATMTEPQPNSESDSSSDGMVSQYQIAPAPVSNKIMTPEEIANLIAAQTIEEIPALAPTSNKIMTPEEIANLIAAQTMEETPATGEESTLSEPENVPDASSDGMVSQDQIEALFTSQSDTAYSEEQPAIVEETNEDQTASSPVSNKIMTPEEIANLIAAQTIEETPAPAPTSNKIMTPEEIANLIAAQTTEETPAPVQEATMIEPEPEPENETGGSSDGMVSQDQIEALFNSQSNTSSSEEQPTITEETSENQTTSAPVSNKIMTPEEIANLIAAQTIEETPAIVEEATMTEPEASLDSIVSQEPPAPAPVSNKIMTPEEIANLIAAQTIEETPAPAPTSNKIMTPEEIANLIAAQTIEETPAPAPTSNKIMTPEEIANLIAAQTTEETPAPVQEATMIEPEPEPENETGGSSDGMVSQDQIEALFNSQSNTSSSEEQPTITEETSENQTTSAPTSNKIMTPEEIANLIAAQAIDETPATVEEPTLTEAEPKNESDASSDSMLSQDQPTLAAISNKIMTPEEIANLIAAQTTEETPAPVEESTLSDPEPQNEPDTSSDGMVSQDQIQALFNSQSDTASSEEQSDITEETNEDQTAPEPVSNKIMTPEDIANLIAAQTIEETPAPVEEATMTEPKPQNETESKESLIKRILSLVSQSIISLKKILPKRNRPKKATEESAPASEEQITEDVTAVGIQDNQDHDEAIVDIPTKPTKEKKAKKTKVPKAPKTPKAPKAPKAGKEPKAPKEPKTPNQKSGLKVGLIILGVLILMSGSFVAGNISRDFFILIQPDPAKVAALEAEKAKEAELKKRAEELAAISPKDYTSSMYLDSIILKGRAGSTTTIKLKKIDDVSKLDQFTKLRRIKLYDMTGAEDLSVLQNLSSLEEIIIENSVLQNQFANGDFKSVTSLEMTNCTVNDPTQFANFKKVTELYADTTKFVTEDGNLKITTDMSSLETLTLTNCGEYVELVGVQNLNQLKTLELTGTVVNKTSYVQNPNITTITVDISFAKNIDQVLALSRLKNFEYLTIQIGTCPISPSELSDAVEQINKAHPDASVILLSY